MDQFNGIHKAIDKVRSTSQTVTVESAKQGNLFGDREGALVIISMAASARQLDSRRLVAPRRLRPAEQT
jgi:hypothetical protein